MCSQSILNEITNKVVRAARECLGDKLDRVILYGSYARGDYDDESDIRLANWRRLTKKILCKKAISKIQILISKIAQPNDEPIG